MLNEQICAECHKFGTEIFSRCGHILHSNCFCGNLFGAIGCPKCGIKLSGFENVEAFIYKIKSSDLFEFDTAVELTFFSDELLRFSSKNEFGSSEAPDYDSSLLEHLQKHGWDINSESFGGTKLFYRACLVDDIDKVNLLIDHGINLEKYGSRGLRDAILNSSYNVVDRLLQKEVKYTSESIFGLVSRKNIRMLTQIIEFGGDVNLKESNGKRLIHIAAEIGSIEMFQFLIKHGADFNAVDNEGNSILHYSCYGKKNSNLVNYLLESGFNFAIKNNKGETPLLLAIKIRNPDVCEILIHNKMKIEFLDGNGNTILHWCVNKDNIELMKFLIAKGLNVNVKNNEGKTPLHLASTNRIVQLLLDKGAEMNVLDNYGKTPFYYFHASIDTELKRRFIKGGTDLTIKNEKGETILELLL